MMINYTNLDYAIETLKAKHREWCNVHKNGSLIPQDENSAYKDALQNAIKLLSGIKSSTIQVFEGKSGEKQIGLEALDNILDDMSSRFGSSEGEWPPLIKEARGAVGKMRATIDEFALETNMLRKMVLNKQAQIDTLQRAVDKRAATEELYMKDANSDAMDVNPGLVKVAAVRMAADARDKLNRLKVNTDTFTAYIGGQVQDGEKREVTIDDIMGYVKHGCSFWAYAPGERYVPTYETNGSILKALREGKDVIMLWNTTDEKWLIKGKVSEAPQITEEQKVDPEWQSIVVPALATYKASVVIDLKRGWKFCRGHRFGVTKPIEECDTLSADEVMESIEAGHFIYTRPPAEWKRSVPANLEGEIAAVINRRLDEHDKRFGTVEALRKSFVEACNKRLADLEAAILRQG